MQVHIALSLNLIEPLTYSIPESGLDQVGLGSRVIVPIGNRLETGWVVSFSSDYTGRIRPVVGWVRDSFRLPPLYLEFVLHAARRFLLPPGILLDSALSPRRRNRRQLRMMVDGEPGPALPALNLQGVKKTKRLLPVEFGVFSRNLGDPGSVFPQKQTGAGFSERLILDYQRSPHYQEMMDACLEKGFSALFLTSDIRTAKEMIAQSPGMVAYHSLLSAADREHAWTRAVGGEPLAVVGGQAALMLPFPRLGIVVVEQPTAWLSRPGGRETEPVPELARLRAAIERIPFVQGDHSHPLAVFRRRSFVVVEDSRCKKKVETKVIPLPPGSPGIPLNLLQRISEHLDAGRRVLVMVNRLQGEDYLFCPHCRMIARCPHCREVILPGKGPETAKTCPNCGGVWKAETTCYRCKKELVRVPRGNLISLRDQVQKRILGQKPPVITAESDSRAMEAAASQDGCRVVMGTWAVLRPEFRQAFTAAIYFRPESDFHFTEYDAAEQIQVVVGRLREWVVNGGHVDVFSTFHFHYGLRLLQSEEAFQRRESKYRRWFHLPPHADLFDLVFRESSQRKVAARMRLARKQIGERMVVMDTRLESRIAKYGKISGLMVVSGSVAALRMTGILNQRDVRVIRKR
ncbi:MAG TPA: hypothetical protein ENN40_10155 [Candidatus Aminicenantes bacterium]|nr:hypothetical protein [Candidatus Aminicenantes bacterium]